MPQRELRSLLLSSAQVRGGVRNNIVSPPHKMRLYSFGRASRRMMMRELLYLFCGLAVVGVLLVFAARLSCSIENSPHCW